MNKLRQLIVLTSSRADYGIYLPLIRKLNVDVRFKVKIIAFGTHLSRFHGYTYDNILEDGFKEIEKIDTMALGDSPDAVVGALGLTIIKFGELWKKIINDSTIIICLGDRYEMYGAVIAALPFKPIVAHIHGGETTLGAMDEVFRHSISLVAQIHFTTHKLYGERVKQIKNVESSVYNVGSLSVEHCKTIQKMPSSEFYKNFGFNLPKRFALLTLHPETLTSCNNGSNSKLLCQVIDQIPNLKFVITMPNADQEGGQIRVAFKELKIKNPEKYEIVENLGTRGYLTALNNCLFVIGNSSSGIIEAGSFNKYVINIGQRQEGRVRGKNVIDVNFDEKEIKSAINKIIKNPISLHQNPYDNGKASDKIINILANY